MKITLFWYFIIKSKTWVEIGDKKIILKIHGNSKPNHKTSFSVQFSSFNIRKPNFPSVAFRNVSPNKAKLIIFIITIGAKSCRKGKIQFCLVLPTLERLLKMEEYFSGKLRTNIHTNLFHPAAAGEWWQQLFRFFSRKRQGAKLG